MDPNECGCEECSSGVRYLHGTAYKDVYLVRRDAVYSGR